MSTPPEPLGTDSSEIVRLPRDDEAIVRLARHRIIYDAALAFYAVLTAFVLNGPLEVLAHSLVTSPIGQGMKDWTTRLLTLALLVKAAIWFHALVASVEKSDSRAPTHVNPHRNRKLYGQSVVLFWSGVVTVVILTALGNAVSLGTLDFLMASFAYVIWSLLSSILERRMQKGSLSWKKLREDCRGDIGAFNILESLAFLVALVGLVVWAQLTPEQGLQSLFQALVWLALVIIAVVAEYCLFMSYYGI